MELLKSIIFEHHVDKPSVEVSQHSCSYIYLLTKQISIVLQLRLAWPDGC